MRVEIDLLIYRLAKRRTKGYAYVSNPPYHGKARPDSRRRPRGVFVVFSSDNMITVILKIFYDP